MPILLPPAEMEIDRATSRLETTKLNPTRIYALATSRGTAFYTAQNGSWFGTGGEHIADETQVPEQFRNDLAEHPITAGVVTGPAIVKVCKFCGEQMNASELDEHYIAHVNTAMAAAGAKTPPADKLTPTPEKSDANQHRRG